MLHFTNNYSAILTAAIGAGDTELPVSTVAGLPAVSVDQPLKITLESVDHSQIEIVHCTAVGASSLTVIRAQEGTPGQAFDATSYVQARLTAEVLYVLQDKYTQAEVDALLDKKQDVENGFPNRVDTTFTFDDGTRVFSIQPTGDDFVYFAEGNRVVSTGETVTISDSEGLWFFYLTGDGTLAATQTFTDEIITRYAFVALLYWDDTNKISLTLAEERHGNTMDSATHLYNHETYGTRYGGGLQPTDIITEGSGNDDAHAQFGVNSGTIWDEDIEIYIDANAFPAQIPFFYQLGPTGVWRKTAPNGFVCLPIGTLGTLPAWNEHVAGTWQLTEVSNNNYILMHLYATNDLYEPYFLVLGQATYATVGQARQAAGSELLALSLAGLPVVEYKSVASFIIQGSSAYNNAVRGRIRETDDGGDYIDWRLVQVGAALSVTGALSQTLNDLTDVTVPTPSDGQPLIYDLASTEWINGDRIALSPATDVAPISVAAAAGQTQDLLGFSVDGVDRFRLLADGQITVAALESNGPTLQLDAPHTGANGITGIQFLRDTVARWSFYAVDEETGSEVGGDLSFLAYDDGGVLLGEVMRLYRATGNVAIAGSLAVTGAITDSGTIVHQDSGTGAAILPAGTTAQRPGSPVEGMFRRNTTTAQFEGYTGSEWAGVGGASGGGGNPFVYENDIVVTADYEITTGKNGMSAGPLTIDPGVTVTVPSGSTWTIV